ncbi:hypothetical protein L6164_017886 [Bauhinia variegata]|uniref:Uncharacterized protein n=1 Tax=Bauhinia variegata TaxID=167791 RepID=A0ACB9N9I5_BAUVA|nr:hypothetical protein L6164_017886 [Bauhinia variegata]
MSWVQNHQKLGPTLFPAPQHLHLYSLPASFPHPSVPCAFPVPPLSSTWRLIDFNHLCLAQFSTHLANNASPSQFSFTSLCSYSINLVLNLKMESRFTEELYACKFQNQRPKSADDQPNNLNGKGPSG